MESEKKTHGGLMFLLMFALHSAIIPYASDEV